MTDSLVRRIADAVLYEGYLLWPYRKSALKNQRRFSFGGVYPPALDEPSVMQAEVLLRGDEDADVDVHVRFLQLIGRQVLRDTAGLEREPVEELERSGKRWVTWEEATEREFPPGPIHVPAGETIEEIPGGAILRSWRALEGDARLERKMLRHGLSMVTVRVSNTSSWAGADRADALRETFCSTHAVLRARSGSWVSQTDPPVELRAEASRCENVGCWPVLVGGPHDTSTMLASPIILPDYPQIAPESPGDLFDSSEIDQMLVLNILALTDEERREMRDCDPRAREILERTEALTPEQLMRLGGAIRELALVRPR